MNRPSPEAESAVERIRALCLALPEVTERLSHGEAAWFVQGKRTLATMADHHHDGRVAVWCAAPPAVQDLLVCTDPGRYFVPPYVGHRGWVGVWLDVAVDWDALARVIRDAYLTVGPERLAARLDQ